MSNVECFYKYFLQIMSVSPDYRGQGIATDLINRSLMLAKCLGYNVCKTEATGDYSRKAFIRAGFTLVTECKYSEFTCDEKKAFAGLQGHQGTALMVKMM